MTPEQIELNMRLESIFTPSARRLRDAIYSKPENARFVHYTSAEAAMKIIQTKRLWLRNIKCMSDYSEAQHGYTLLNEFFHNEANKTEFVSTLDSCLPSVALKAVAKFDEWWRDIQFNTYVASISEHDAPTEDRHGRLSMWRGFGGSKSARVAIVLRIPAISTATVPVNVFFNPVVYQNKDKVYAEIKEVIENVKNNREFLSSMDESRLIACVFNMLVSGVTCSKHEGFHEEREWRAIYIPRIWHSDFTERMIETIDGIPQIIYRLPLDATFSDNLAHLDFVSLFDRLVIGPSQYSFAQVDAFIEALIHAGVLDADKRVVFSGIPIRT